MLLMCTYFVEKQKTITDMSVTTPYLDPFCDGVVFWLRGKNVERVGHVTCTGDDVWSSVER